ncbi:TetR/AcrR family transcriptional regulator [Lysinibacter cavernae]|uniref:AcrR family transcriptional regulator n=1 Tax=Lysinibacter cavernae TaxID=1640652 RepID=A0A7X5R0J2_9MICO|nr:TetR family transcriptional regulator [Lysinibacter cavernae]NIH53444.1 AcrR family transcriptional regulator [Lysinibacter cavernae]
MSESAGTARERILEAYTSLLMEGNERAATLDAVAALAGVSKGGLLYHFPSKEALASGLIAELDVLAAADLIKIRTSPLGPVEYFIRTSVSEGSKFDNAIIATMRLATDSPAARDALHTLRVQWHDVLYEAVGDEQLAQTILLISDGIYYNTAIMTEERYHDQNHASVEDALAVIQRLTGK